jgi:hypothetical protein
MALLKIFPISGAMRHANLSHTQNFFHQQRNSQLTLLTGF